MTKKDRFGRHEAAPIQKGRQTPAEVFTHGLSTISGSQWKFRFANGYGASVINDGYGREEGLYELAVLGPDGHLTYDTPITDDVLGYLTRTDVADALDRIEALPTAVA